MTDGAWDVVHDLAKSDPWRKNFEGFAEFCWFCEDYYPDHREHCVWERARMLVEEAS